MHVDRPLAYPGLPVPRIALPFLVTAVRRLAVEIDLLPADILAVALAQDLVLVVEVAPAELPAVGVVDRHDPLGQTRAAEGLGLGEALEHGPVLRQVRGQVVVEADHDQILDPARVAVKKAGGELVVDDHRQLDEMLQAGELRAADPPVQESTVVGVDRVLALLQPVAGRMDRIGHQVVIGNVEGIQVGERGLFLGRAQVGEDQSLDLLHRIGALADLVTDRAVGRLAGCLQDGAVHIVMPAVIAAAQPPLLDLAELERRPAVRAVAVQEPDPAAPVPEYHQVLAQYPDRDRVFAQLLGHGDRMPKAAHVLATRRPGPDLGQLRVRLQPRVDGVSVIGPGGPANLFDHWSDLCAVALLGIEPARDGHAEWRSRSGRKL